MDLSMLGFDESTCFAPLDPEAKQRMYGSDSRGLKMAKTEDFYSSVLGNKQMLRSNNSSLSEGQMLSFSLSDCKSGGFDLYNNGLSGYCTNTGYGFGGGGMNGVRGPFTASQWMELEHQALIYKYILANIPVPSNLLYPIQRALNLLRPNAYGWGGFHFGFSSNTDPEPGRCRRTDGKKWRCSRDAVPDQKYCERHINRGRHRSRKPVEGQNGPTNTAATAAAATSAKETAAVVTGGGGASGLGSSLHINGIFLNKNNAIEKSQSVTDLSMFSSGNNSKTNQFPHEKNQNQSQYQFGLVSFDSLINPIQETPSSKPLNSRETLFQPSSVHRHQFIDEWPQNTEEKAASPLRLSSKKADWVPISWEGPLGEVLHNTNQANSNEIKLFSGLNLMNDLARSPNGPFHSTTFGSQSNSSAGSSPRGTSAALAPLL